MTRRTRELDPERRRLLLDVAAEEFAAHGFDGASFNRIIERAGLSKGVIYYYFADKADLWRVVVEEALGGALWGLPSPPTPADAEAFWSGLVRGHAAVVLHFLHHPRDAALARAFARAMGHPALADAQRELEARTMAWMAGVLLQGQAVGAVRTDLEPDLLLAVAFGVLQATDLWTLERWDGLTDEDAPGLAATVIGLVRRMLAPGAA